MKFSYSLAPLSFLSLVVNGKSTTESYNRPVSFTGPGIQNVIDLKKKGSIAFIDEAITSTKNFFKRNPAVLKSITKVTNQSKHKKTKDDIIKRAVSLYHHNGGKLDLPAVRVTVVNYVYDHPKVLDLFQQIMLQVVKDHPTLVDDFYKATKKLAKTDPQIFRKMKKTVIELSERHEDIYDKVFEMLLKTASLKPKLASKVITKALVIDEIICSDSDLSECTCKDNKSSKGDTDKKVETKKPKSKKEPKAKSKTFKKAKTAKLYSNDYAKPKLRNDPIVSETTQPQPKAIEIQRPSTKSKKSDPTSTESKVLPKAFKIDALEKKPSN